MTLRIVVATLCLLLPGRWARADSINLLSQSGTTYVYGLTFTSKTDFLQNDTITISGLTGITSVTPSNFAKYLGYTSFTQGSVTLSMAGNGSYGPGRTYTLFTINTSQGESDFGQYAIQEATTTESGAVAVTPEPRSVLLLATGMLLCLSAPVTAWWRRYARS